MMQFHSKSKLLVNHPFFPPDAMRRLSNFSMDDVEYNGIIYPSVEHAYQAQKYYYSKHSYLISMFYDGTLQSPEDAKKAGSKSGMKKFGVKLNVEEQIENNELLMSSLIQSKINRYYYIKNILRLAKDNNIKFVHFSRTDMGWGAHLSDDRLTIKKGLNKLGELYNNFL